MFQIGGNRIWQVAAVVEEGPNERLTEEPVNRLDPASTPSGTLIPDPAVMPELRSCTGDVGPDGSHGNVAEIKFYTK